jgi:hypothetical protein
MTVIENQITLLEKNSTSFIVDVMQYVSKAQNRARTFFFESLKPTGFF